MRLVDFEKKIKHLSQERITSYTLSTIGHLLIEKRLVTRDEFQNKFLGVMRKHQEKELRKHTSRRIK